MITIQPQIISLLGITEHEIIAKSSSSAMLTGSLACHIAYFTFSRRWAKIPIQEILGHESIMTTNLYTVTTEQDKVEALESLEW